jgi:tRNA G18 (ribose-2'-O)-methylase SpoU
MGHAFRVPLAESVDLERDLQQIREAGVTLVAAVVDPAAEPLTSFRRTGSLALLLGNEADGLEPRWVALSQRQLVIPMAAGVDSLNVTVAAGIILHAVTSTRPGDRGFEPGEPPG